MWICCVLFLYHQLQGQYEGWDVDIVYDKRNEETVAFCNLNQPHLGKVLLFHPDQVPLDLNGTLSYRSLTPICIRLLIQYCHLPRSIGAQRVSLIYK